MRVLLNTLYVTTPESYLSKDGMNLVVSVKQKEVFRIPIVNIEQVVLFGYMGASPGAMKLCLDNRVPIVYLSPNGQFISRLQGKECGNVLLRVKQYANANDAAFKLHISKMFISGKVYNYRSILCRYLRDYGENANVRNMVNHIDQNRKAILESQDITELRGIEGDAANAYFSVFQYLILHQKELFKFNGRNKRPPRDPANVLLSFVYTLLANEVASALESVGLDPYVGFMHTLRPGRISLALDVMEELRAYMGDRLVFSLINRRQIDSNDFIFQADDTVVLTEKGRKTVITAWQSRKKEELIHPFLKEKVCVGLLPYVQSLLLSRYLRGDLDDYPVFLIK